LKAAAGETGGAYLGESDGAYVGAELRPVDQPDVGPHRVHVQPAAGAQVRVTG